jgi:hypothetical protein
VFRGVGDIALRPPLRFFSRVIAEWLYYITTVLWEKYSITHCTKMIQKALTWEAKAFIPWLNRRGIKQSGQSNASGCTFEEVDNIDMRNMCFQAYQQHITHCTKMIQKALTWEAKAFIPWLNRYLDRVADIRDLRGIKQSGQSNASGCTFEEVDNIDMRNMCFQAYPYHRVSPFGLCGLAGGSFG